MKKQPFTSCQNCAFLTMDDKHIQNGCSADMLKNFSIEKTIPGDFGSFHILNGVCRMYRQNDGTPVENQLDKQRKRIKPRMAAFVMSDGNEEKLKLTIDSLNNFDEVVVADASGNNLSHMVNSVNYKNSFCLRYDLEMPEDLFFSQSCQKIKNSMICVVRAGYNVPIDLSQEMDDRINVKVAKDIFFKFDDCYVTYSIVAQKVNYFMDMDLEEKLERLQCEN